MTHDHRVATPRTTDDDTVIIAADEPERWQALSARLTRYIEQLAKGQLTLGAADQSHGIIGPQVDGCVRVDIELFLAPVLPPTPAHSKSPTLEVAPLHERCGGH